MLPFYYQSRGLKAHPCIEVYFGGYIHFMMPLSSNEDFYSPETSVKVEVGSIVDVRISLFITMLTDRQLIDWLGNKGL